MKLKRVELTNNVNYRIVKVKILEIGFFFTKVMLSVELFDRETGIVIDEIEVKAISRGFDTSKDWHNFINRKQEEGVEFEKNEKGEVEYFSISVEVKKEFDNYVNKLYEEIFNDFENNHNFNFKFYKNKRCDSRYETYNNLDDCDYLDYNYFYFIKNNNVQWVNLYNAKLIGYNKDTKNKRFRIGGVEFEDDEIFI